MLSVHRSTSPALPIPLALAVVLASIVLLSSELYRKLSQDLQIYSFFFSLQNFSCNIPTMKIASVVYFPDVKPHCRLSSTLTIVFNLFNSICLILGLLRTPMRHLFLCIGVLSNCHPIQQELSLHVISF